GGAWLTDNAGPASLWLPPGRPEVPEEMEPRFEPMVTELVGTEQASVMMEVFDRFDAAHPDAEPHYYLSLLGTHPDFRGRGLGMNLLADNLDAIDAEGIPSYLESSNPANDHRYERLGYKRHGAFDLPEDGPPVGTMWRQAAASEA